MEVGRSGGASRLEPSPRRGSAEPARAWDGTARRALTLSIAPPVIGYLLYHLSQPVQGEPPSRATLRIAGVAGLAGFLMALVEAIRGIVALRRGTGRTAAAWIGVLLGGGGSVLYVVGAAWVHLTLSGMRAAPGAPASEETDPAERSRAPFSCAVDSGRQAAAWNDELVRTAPKSMVNRPGRAGPATHGFPDIAERGTP